MKFTSIAQGAVMTVATIATLALSNPVAYAKYHPECVVDRVLFAVNQATKHGGNYGYKIALFNSNGVNVRSIYYCKPYGATWSITEPGNIYTADLFAATSQSLPNGTYAVYADSVGWRGHATFTVTNN